MIRCTSSFAPVARRHRSTCGADVYCSFRRDVSKRRAQEGLPPSCRAVFKPTATVVGGGASAAHEKDILSNAQRRRQCNWQWATQRRAPAAMSQLPGPGTREITQPLAYCTPSLGRSHPPAAQPPQHQKEGKPFVPFSLMCLKAAGQIIRRPNGPEAC